MASSTEQTFSATYTSPTNAPFSAAKAVPVPASNSVESRSAYLASLRKAAAGIQEEVNRELTARMEEDKAREASANGKKVDVDEAKEEENYGEEVVEEEE